MENISSYVILYANKAAFLALPQGVILKSIFFYTVVVEQQFDERLVNSQACLFMVYWHSNLQLTLSPPWVEPLRKQYSSWDSNYIGQAFTFTDLNKVWY